MANEHNSSKFNGLYRIASTRIPHWNYANAAAYFVTLCTMNRHPHLGFVKDDIIYLTELGRIMEREWLHTPSIRPDMNLTLLEHVIMPDHFHGILVIGENSANSAQTNDDSSQSTVNSFGPQAKNLASIMRGLKSSVTMYARINRLPFAWQRGFYERIIRDERELVDVVNYIRDNPQELVLKLRDDSKKQQSS